MLGAGSRSGAATRTKAGSAANDAIADVKAKNQQLAQNNTILAVRLRGKEAEIEQLRSENLALRQRLASQKLRVDQGSANNECCRQLAKRHNADLARVSMLSRSTDEVFTSLVAHLRSMADNFEANVVTAWRETQEAVLSRSTPPPATPSSPIVDTGQPMSATAHSTAISVDINNRLLQYILPGSQPARQQLTYSARNKRNFQGRLKRVAGNVSTARPSIATCETTSGHKISSLDEEQGIADLCDQFDKVLPTA